MKRSINAHEPRIVPVGGQHEVTCKCALLRMRKFNRESDAQRYYDQHVQRMERSSHRQT